MGAVDAPNVGGASSSSCEGAGVGGEEDADDEVVEEGEIRETGDEPEKVDLKVDERRLKELVDPRRPSVAEVEAYWRGNHGAYRNWCPVCVKARGKDLDHRADAHEGRG